MNNATQQQDPTLRTPEDQLAQARKQYVNSLTNEQQFEADCLIIIPDLERLWEEKVLIFGFPADTLMEWKPYLRVFKPQTLAAGIDLLVKRLESHVARYGSVLPREELLASIPKKEFAQWSSEKRVELINRAGGVQNVRAYYRSLVQDLRREEIKANPIRKHFNETIMKLVLEQASGDDITFAIPQQTYDDAGVHLPAEHRRFAVKMGWIEEVWIEIPKLRNLGEPEKPAGALEKIPTGKMRDNLTAKGAAVLEGLRGGFGIAFLIAVN